MKKTLFDDEQVNHLLFKDLLPPLTKEEIEEVEEHHFSSLHEDKMNALFASMEKEENEEIKLPFFSLAKNVLVTFLFLILLATPSLSSLAMDSSFVSLNTEVSRTGITLNFVLKGEPLPSPQLKIKNLPDGCRLNKEERTVDSHLMDYFHPKGYVLTIEKIRPTKEPLVLTGEKFWEKKTYKEHYIYIKKDFKFVYLFRDNWLYKVTTSNSLEFGQEILQEVE